MSCESKCAKWFRSGDAACKGCGSCERCKESCIGGVPIDEIGPSDCEECDEPNCDNRVADYIGDEDSDEPQSSNHEDEFGNVGRKLYEVEVEVVIHRRATKKVTVAADDEVEAESRGQSAVEDMDEDEIDFSDECDNDVVSCEEKDDFPF